MLGAEPLTLKFARAAAIRKKFEQKASFFRISICAHAYTETKLRQSGAPQYPENHQGAAGSLQVEMCSECSISRNENEKGGECMALTFDFPRHRNCCQEFALCLLLRTSTEPLSELFAAGASHSVSGNKGLSSPESTKQKGMHSNLPVSFSEMLKYHL